MDRIWAPWRIDYIVGGERESGCIFCSKSASDEDDRNLIVHRGQGAFTMMNKFPYNNGHVLVAPFRHASDICQLDGEENKLLLEEVCRSMGVIRDVMHAEGFNVGINIGAVAGAGFEDHVHYHVVPRWSGDTNIMPVLADVKIIPEHLLSTCRKLRDRFSLMHSDSANEEKK